MKWNRWMRLGGDGLLPALPEDFLGAQPDLFGALERPGVAADRLWLRRRRIDRLPSLAVALIGQQGGAADDQPLAGGTFLDADRGSILNAY